MRKALHDGYICMETIARNVTERMQREIEGEMERRKDGDRRNSLGIEKQKELILTEKSCDDAEISGDDTMTIHFFFGKKSS